MRLINNEPPIIETVPKAPSWILGKSNNDLYRICQISQPTFFNNTDLNRYDAANSCAPIVQARRCLNSMDKIKCEADEIIRQADEEENDLMLSYPNLRSKQIIDKFISQLNNENDQFGHRKELMKERLMNKAKIHKAKEHNIISENKETKIILENYWLSIFEKQTLGNFEILVQSNNDGRIRTGTQSNQKILNWDDLTKSRDGRKKVENMKTGIEKVTTLLTESSHIAAIHKIMSQYAVRTLCRQIYQRFKDTNLPEIEMRTVLHEIVKQCLVQTLSLHGVDFLTSSIQTHIKQHCDEYKAQILETRKAYQDFEPFAKKILGGLMTGIAAFFSSQVANYLWFSGQSELFSSSLVNLFTGTDEKMEIVNNHVLIIEKWLIQSVRMGFIESCTYMMNSAMFFNWIHNWTFVLMKLPAKYSCMYDRELEVLQDQIDSNNL